VQGATSSLTNTNRKSYNTGTLSSDISDHFINFIQIPDYKVTKKACNHIFLKNLSDDNVNRFKNNLDNFGWDDVLGDNDVNSSFGKFWQIFKEFYDINFPLVRTKLNRNIHKVNKYMTNGLLISRNNKLRLHKLAIKNPTVENVTGYVRFRNLYNKTLRASKKLYFEQSLNEHSTNSKKNLGNS
jgi:hypothetical protein